MKKIRKKEVKIQRAMTGIIPLSNVLVSCGGKNESNIITVGMAHSINSEPPLIGISIRRNRYNYKLLKKYPEFVINYPDIKLIEENDYLGIVSGGIY